MSAERATPSSILPPAETLTVKFKSDRKRLSAQLYLVSFGVFGGERQGRVHPASRLWPDSARADGVELHPPTRADQTGGGDGLVSVDRGTSQRAIASSCRFTKDRVAWCRTCRDGRLVRRLCSAVTLNKRMETDAQVVLIAQQPVGQFQ